MNNIAGALYRVIKIKKRNEVQPENEVSVTPVSVQTAMITQLYLQITPCLPLPRKHSPDGATADT